MRRTALVLLAALGLTGASSARDNAPAPGAYRQHHIIDIYQGPDHPPDLVSVDAVLEIVPIDRGHAYLRARMYFANGHTCSLYGVATEEGGALVYRPRHAMNGPCVVRLRRKGSRLVFDDPGWSCRINFCGARGVLSNEGFASSGRRPIRYMKRLLASREYADAFSEWHESPDGH